MDPLQGADKPVTPDGRIKIQCDSYGCLNAISTPTKTRRDVAEEYAFENGWAEVDRHMFCPLHIAVHPRLWPAGAIRDLPTPGEKELNLPQVAADAEPFTVENPK